MRALRFEQIVNEQLEQVRSKMGQKAAEYAKPDDPLHTIRKSAQMQEITLLEALSGMMAPVAANIFDMMQSSQQHPLGVWDKKITSLMSYLALLRTAVEEEQQIAEPPATTSLTIQGVAGENFPYEPTAS
jgi:hypothetical protein